MQMILLYVLNGDFTTASAYLVRCLSLLVDAPFNEEKETDPRSKLHYLRHPLFAMDLSFDTIVAPARAPCHRLPYTKFV